MSDPLSIIASLIAVGSLNVQVSALVKRVLHASDHVLALENELRDVEALTKQLETVCREDWLVEHQATVDNAKRILEEDIRKRLQCLKGYLAKHSRASKPKFPTHHIAWAALHSKINTQREGLRNGKERLLSIFHILNTSNTRRVTFQATQIGIDIEKIRDSQSLVAADTSSSRETAEILQLVQRLQIGVDELNVKLEQGSGENPPRYAQAATADAQHSAQSKTTALPAEATPGSGKAYQLVNCVLEGRESKGGLWCTCACHSPRKHMSLPSSLERVAGQLLVGCSVHPWLRPWCNLQSCKRSSETRVRLRYRFPAWWFIAYSVTLLAQPSNAGLVLRFPHVRPCDAPVFEMVSHGRLDALRQAFSMKTASIFDTENTGGHTLLHRALITKNVDVIDFLLKRGADTLAVNQKTNRSADIFWRTVLSNGLPEAAYGRLASHFDDTSFIEDGGFTIIHKIIFGQSKADLDQCSTSSRTSSTTRTPTASHHSTRRRRAATCDPYPLYWSTAPT